MLCTELSACQPTSCPVPTLLPDSSAWRGDLVALAASSLGVACHCPKDMAPTQHSPLASSAYLPCTLYSVIRLREHRALYRAPLPPHGTLRVSAGAGSSARSALPVPFHASPQLCLADSPVSFNWLRCHFLREVFHFPTHQRPALSAPLSSLCHHILYPCIS